MSDRPPIHRVDEALADVSSRARGRTRYEGQDRWHRLDEVMAAEIERLRAEVKHWRDKVAPDIESKTFEEAAGIDVPKPQDLPIQDWTWDCALREYRAAIQKLRLRR